MKIEKFYINNFRSLVNFKVEDFDSTTIFYGENNAGKSNVLKALEFIFQRKVQYADGDLTSPKNFYEGVIKGFSNNFFNNNKELVIDFSIEISISKNDTEIKDTIIRLFNKWPNDLRFSIQGKITNSPQGNDFAEIETNIIKVNNIPIYEADSKSIIYFQSLQSLDKSNAGELSNAFAHFINPLNDCVYIIGSTRDTHPTQFNTELLNEFAPTDFKKSLYSLYLNGKNHTIFEKINSFFNASPFSFGTISFACINGELELMIKSDDIRLPIKHLGSGVEQILFIITCLIYSKSKIICIEELEQNLSPKLQNLALRKLQSMIGKFFDQIIISSHSSVFAKPKLSKAIYLIKKENLITIQAERLNDKYGKELKVHFIDVVPPNDTYTDDELKNNLEEINKLTEQRFKM